MQNRWMYILDTFKAIFYKFKSTFTTFYIHCTWSKSKLAIEKYIFFLHMEAHLFSTKNAYTVSKVVKWFFVSVVLVQLQCGQNS